mmetsp:Transcript_45271/g.113972  ORF Transcript_45271/g.113972 Transcript_45271/m.113972 type:complete len:280 (+) Transcript_45271:417-1256(+)
MNNLVDCFLVHRELGRATLRNRKSNFFRGCGQCLCRLQQAVVSTQRKGGVGGKAGQPGWKVSCPEHPRVNHHSKHPTQCAPIDQTGCVSNQLCQHGWYQRLVRVKPAASERAKVLHALLPLICLGHLIGHHHISQGDANMCKFRVHDRVAVSAACHAIINNEVHHHGEPCETAGVRQVLAHALDRGVLFADDRPQVGFFCVFGGDHVATEGSAGHNGGRAAEAGREGKPIEGDRVGMTEPCDGVVYQLFALMCLHGSVRCDLVAHFRFVPWVLNIIFHH